MYIVGVNKEGIVTCIISSQIFQLRGITQGVASRKPHHKNLPTVGLDLDEVILHLLSEPGVLSW